jgi:hypothetical protein
MAPLARTVINFLILPFGLAMCWILAWLIEIYPPHYHPTYPVLHAVIDVLKFFMIFYCMGIALSLLWIIYMIYSLRLFKNHMAYFRVNKYILIVSASVLTLAALSVWW